MLLLQGTSDSDASLSSHYSSSDDLDLGSYSQAAIHQVAQALTKAAEHVAQQHPQKYDDSELVCFFFSLN